MENEELSNTCKGCGQPLSEGAQSQTHPNLSPLGLERVIRGALFCGGGIIVGTLVVAADGGTYIMAWGAIVYGVIQIYKGFRTDPSGARSIHQAKQLLELAAHLESVHPGRAIDVYRQVVHQCPGTNESAEAERNIKTLITHNPALAPQPVSLGVARN
jgi:hypothetical protein